MRDSILELWMRLVALHMEEPTKDDSVIRRIRDQWLLGSRGYFNGCIPIDLNEDVSSDAGRKLITNAINSVLKQLAQAPDTLDKDVLNLLGIDSGSFTKNIETWRLVEVGEAFLALIDGKITGTAESTEFMPGCRDKPNSHGHSTFNPQSKPRSRSGVGGLRR